MANRYQISKSAKGDLATIYKYGLHKFGEAQADEYYYTFLNRFEQLVVNPYLYPSVDHIREGYRRSVCGADSIYYCLNSDTVEIMRILGQQDTDSLI